VQFQRVLKLLKNLNSFFNSLLKGTLTETAEVAEVRSVIVVYHFKIHEEQEGLWAECMELKGCLTQGESLQELMRNMKEALDLFLDEPENSGIPFPLPNESICEMENVVRVKVDPSVAFAYYMRITRLKHNMTQRDAAKMLNFKNLYSYQRLESSKKTNPELKTLEKIKKAFPEFDLNLVV